MKISECSLHLETLSHTNYTEWIASIQDACIRADTEWDSDEKIIPLISCVQAALVDNFEGADRRLESEAQYTKLKPGKSIGFYMKIH